MALKIEFEKKDRAIELPDGTVLDVPERTKNNEEKIQEVLQNRLKLKEYDFLINILEAIFGKSGVKKIAPNPESVNLDFLTVVYTKSIELFYADKTSAEQEEVAKRTNELEDISAVIKELGPIINSIK